MNRFELVAALVAEQLVAYRPQICHENVEQLTIVVKFKPHAGPPRSVQVQCLNVYDAPAASNAPPERPPAKPETLDKR